MDEPKYIQLQGSTDVGCIRSGNEDCYVIQVMSQEQEALNPTRVFEIREEGDLFAAVSDGMGGAAAGEVASQTALDTLNHYLLERHHDLEKANPAQTVQIFERGLQLANKAILEKAQQTQNRRGMGATITALYLKKDIMFIFQIGDSRAYVLRDGKLVRVTRDQSFVGHLVEMGTITEDQAMRHPQRNVILQALGTQENLKIDVSYLPLCKGDLVLLCSDGLYSEINPDQLKRRVRDLASGDFGNLAEGLIEDAKKAGGRDNITVIGIKVKDGMPPSEPGETPRYLPFPQMEKDNPLENAQSIFQ